MRITRRAFGWQTLASAAGGWLTLSSGTNLRAETVPLQPFAAHVERLIIALSAVGSPLFKDEVARLNAAARSSSEAAALEQMQAVLDKRVLLEVDINPEMRLSVRRGSAPAQLVQSGWRTFLVKIQNAAGATTGLLVKSPQGGSMGRKSSFAITGVHDFTNGAVDAVEARSRWIALAVYDAPPLTAKLSGLGLEYRILQIYSRDAGKREASLQVDAGFGEQDLGFRSTVPILFDCLAARAVALRINDERGKPCTASLLITDSLGRIYPAQGKRALPDLAFEPQVYRGDGEDVLLADGLYELEFGRGPEYLRESRTFSVTPAQHELALALKRWVTPSEFGYYSGDTHIHAAGCSHYESPSEGVPPEVMRRQVLGEALDLGSVLNWGPGYLYQKQFFSGHEAHVSGRNAGSTLLRYDVEVSGFPSSHCGHLVLLQMHEDSYPGSHTIDEWPSWNLPILRWAKAQGAITGYAHAGHGLVVQNTSLPNFDMPPFDSMGANEFLVDITHPGTVDFLSGCDLWPFAELNLWYHTLNCGFRSAFAGETDFPCITDERVGGGRSYVRLNVVPEGDIGYAAWLEALVSGDCYFGDGRSHIFDLRVEGADAAKAGSGRTLRLAGPAAVTVSAKICARLEPEQTTATRTIASASPFVKPYWHLERARIRDTRRITVELVVNGYAVDRTQVEADGSIQPVTFRHTPDRSSWYALRILPSSHTNPYVVELGGKPLRASRRSAEWCRQALDVLWQQKQTRIRASELKDASAAYDHARSAYESVARESLPDESGG